MMIDYVTGLWLMATFLIVTGIIFYGWSRQGGEAWRTISLLYIFLAHIVVVGAIGLQAGDGTQAPCENLINWSNDTNPSPGSERNLYYYYYDSCAGREPPATFVRSYTIGLWMLYCAGFGLFLYIFYMVGRWISGRW